MNVYCKGICVRKVKRLQIVLPYLSFRLWKKRTLSLLTLLEYRRFIITLYFFFLVRRPIFITWFVYIKGDEERFEEFYCHFIQHNTKQNSVLRSFFSLTFSSFIFVLDSTNRPLLTIYWIFWGLLTWHSSVASFKVMWRLWRLLTSTYRSTSRPSRLF